MPVTVSYFSLLVITSKDAVTNCTPMPAGLQSLLKTLPRQAGVRAAVSGPRASSEGAAAATAKSLLASAAFGRTQTLDWHTGKIAGVGQGKTLERCRSSSKFYGYFVLLHRT